MKTEPYLKKIAGTWVEKKYQDYFMRTAIKTEFDFSAATPRIKTSTKRALRNGVCGTYSGKTSALFMLLSGMYDLRATCASASGTVLRTNFYDPAYYDDLVAANSLVHANAARYMHHTGRAINCYGWYAEARVVENLFEPYLMTNDAEQIRREEAIAMLNSETILTFSWIDGVPLTVDR